MSAGTPLGNAPAGSLLAVLKTECIYRQEIQSFVRTNTIIHQFTYVYNYQRIQVKTELTPYEERCQLQYSCVILCLGFLCLAHWPGVGFTA